MVMTKHQLSKLLLGNAPAPARTTDNTGLRLVADMGAAYAAGAIVTPVVSAVDRALAENASGKAKLFPSFFASLREMVTSPVKFVKSPQFGYIWLVYGSTYAAANVVETLCAKTGTDVKMPKWLATSAVNTTTCIMKDKAFARLFGTKVPTNVPIGSYGAWLGRDLISMAVFFTLPPIVGKQLATQFYDGNESKGYYAAQIVLPLGIQFITTPIHLLGYDIYNNPTNTVGERVAFLKKDYFKNVGIRMIRMAPPWSFGTIGNKYFRDTFTAALVPAAAPEAKKA